MKRVHNFHLCIKDFIYLFACLFSELLLISLLYCLDLLVSLPGGGGTLIFCGYIGEAPASTPKPKNMWKKSPQRVLSYYQLRGLVVQVNHLRFFPVIYDLLGASVRKITCVTLARGQP